MMRWVVILWVLFTLGLLRKKEFAREMENDVQAKLMHIVISKKQEEPIDMPDNGQ